MEDDGFMSRMREAWRETVGAYATDDGETRNLLSRLAEFGHLSKEEAGNFLGDVRQRIEDNKRELDRTVEESLRLATMRPRGPSDEEIASLQRTLDRLEARLMVLEE